MLSIALAVAFYGMVVFAVGYGMNQIELAMSLHGSGLVTADTMAKLFHSEVMAKILILGDMCGIATSWNFFDWWKSCFGIYGVFLYNSACFLQKIQKISDALSIIDIDRSFIGYIFIFW